MNDEEISCNLKQLKQYSRDFDIYEARWKASYGKKDAYEAMMEAKRNYVSHSDWLWSQGIDVVWEGDLQEYVAKERKGLYPSGGKRECRGRQPFAGEPCLGDR